MNESGECIDSVYNVSGKIKVRKKLGYVKIVSSDERNKYELKAYEYGWPRYTIFKMKKNRSTLSLKLNDEQECSIHFGYFAFFSFHRTDSVYCRRIIYDF